MNISFFNPSFLWGLGFVSLPFIIHLLNRKKPRLIPFSDLRLLRLATVRVIQRHKLKQWLLLVLRALLILLATLLFARPVLRLGGLFGQTKGGISSVLILDTSYSMGYLTKQKNSFVLARQLAGRIVDLAKENEQLALLSASQKVDYPVPQFTASHQKDFLKKKIAQVQLSYFPGDFQPALASAYQLLAGSPTQIKRIILISDLQANGFGKIDVKNIRDFDSRVTLILVDAGAQNPQNLTVTRVEAKEAWVGEPLKIETEVQNFSTQDINNLPLALFLNQREVAKGFVSLKEQRPASKNFSFTLPFKPVHGLGYALLPEDNLSSDNRFFFQFPLKEKIKVLVLDGQPGPSSFASETFYLRLALNPAQDGPFTVKVTTPFELESLTLESYDLVLACNVVFTSGQAKKIIDYHQAGGKLIFFLGDQVLGPDYNRLFGGLLPGEIREVLTADPARHIRLPNPEIFSSFKEGNLSSAQFSKYFQIVPSAQAAVLLRIAGSSADLNEDQPLLLEKEGVLVLTSSADGDWNDLCTKPVYLPLMQQVARDLVQKEKEETGSNIYSGTKNYLKVGQTLRRAFLPNRLPSGFMIKDPPGKEYKISPAQQDKFLGLEFDQTFSPGIYEVNWTEKSRASREYFVVNLDRESGESDLGKIEPGRLKKIFSPAHLVHIDQPEKLEDIFHKILYGKEVTPVLVFLLLGFFLAEGFLSKG